MELKSYLSIVVRRKWIILSTFLLLMIMVIIAGQFMPQKYSATARLRVKTPVGGSPNYVDFNIWYADRLMNTYAELAWSSSIREELRQKLNLPANPDISVSVVPSSELIKITAKSQDPVLSATLANTLAQIIVDHSRELNDLSRVAANDFLSERISQVGEQLEKAHLDYEQMVNPVAADKARIDLLGRTIDQDNQIYISLKEIYEQSRTTGTSALRLSSTERQMADLQQKINQEQAELEGLNAKLTESTDKLDVKKGEIDLLEKEQANLVSLLDQARITELIQENTFALPVVDPAIPPTTQSSSSRLLIYAIGMIFSLGAALILAFIVDNLDSRLFSTEQIVSATQLQLLGKIPYTETIKFDNCSESRDAYSEAIRRLRINISRIVHINDLKSLVFCSTDPREGKSTIISSLAIDLALVGKKVIIIDADMRKPSIHRYLNLLNENGLSNYIQGDSDLEEVIQDTAYSNLKVITSGDTNVNPAELLSLNAMQDLIQRLKSVYDVVLIDSPALLAVSDIDELATFVDGAILVVQRGRARETQIHTATRLLNNLKSQPVGLVVNWAESNGTYHYYTDKPKSSNWLSKINIHSILNGRS